jgi:hypothetical protein
VGWRNCTMKRVPSDKPARFKAGAHRPIFLQKVREVLRATAQLLLGSGGAPAEGYLARLR